ncbi:mechanosensitive ion channel family protein [Arthrobacter flavus]|uniref:Mechanosensitive ion channel domain-containing protein n=1 Tax=Arthrobacter flavus TaxID=95172 RepID=A0ABW4QBN5_9MICC
MDLTQLDLTQYLPATTSWWAVLAAAFSIIAGWITARYARRATLVLLTRTPGISDDLSYLVARIIQYVLILGGVGFALAFLGVNVQPLLAIVIVAVVAFVLVVRGFVENFTASMLIQSRQPVRVGDEIQVEGPESEITGTITELNARSVIMVTVDGRTVHTPNAILLGGVVVNHSRQGLRRSEVQVRTSRDDGGTLEATLAFLRAAVAEVEGVADSKPPRALAVATSPNRWTVRVQYWHHPLSGPSVTSDVLSGLSGALEDAGRSVSVTAVPGEPPLIPPDLL